MAAKSIEKRETAWLYYLTGMQKKDICNRVGISAPTLIKWERDGNWEVKRAGQNVTRVELVNKILAAVAKTLDSNTETPDPNLPDKLAKFASTIASLDKKNNPVNDIETFMGFNKYLQALLKHDKSLSLDFIKRVNQYQDAYITERVTAR